MTENDTSLCIRLIKNKEIYFASAGKATTSIKFSLHLLHFSKYDLYDERVDADRDLDRISGMVSESRHSSLLLTLNRGITCCLMTSFRLLLESLALVPPWALKTPVSRLTTREADVPWHWVSVLVADCLELRSKGTTGGTKKLVC